MLSQSLNSGQSKAQLVFLAIIRYYALIAAAAATDVSDTFCSAEQSVTSAKVVNRLTLVLLGITLVFMLASAYWRSDKRFSFGMIGLNGIWLIVVACLFRLNEDCAGLLNLARVCVLAPILCFLEGAALFYFQPTTILYFTLVRGQILWTVLALVGGLSCGSFENHFAAVGILQLIVFIWALTNSFLRDLFREKLGRSLINQSSYVILGLQFVFYCVAVIFLLSVGEPADTTCGAKWDGLQTYLQGGFVELIVLSLSLVWGRQQNDPQLTASE